MSDDVVMVEYLTGENECEAASYQVETRHSGPVEMPTFHAKPCPFCGAQPTCEFYHGGGPQKRLIQCGNAACRVAPSVTGPTRREALRRWNHRLPSPSEAKNG